MRLPLSRSSRKKDREFYMMEALRAPGTHAKVSQKTRRPKRKLILILALCLLLIVTFAAARLHARRSEEKEEDYTFDPLPESETDVSSEEEEKSTVSPDDPRLLMLVNASNPLPEGYEIDPVVLRYGMVVDRLCYDDLQAMMDDCRAAGLKPLICSAYRTVEKQQELYEAKVTEFMHTGLSLAEAEEKAAAVVAYPGTSEHHTGLALDIVDETYQLLEPEQERTAVSRWLTAHAWEYGFIIRYPVEKTRETGIIYEPWHYRYVGRELAKEITESGLCLEEYCSSLAG